MASNNITRDPAMLEEAGRLAYERKIPFSDALAQVSGKTPRLAKEKKQVTRKDFEELQAGIRELAERSQGQLEMACEREFTQMCVDGTVERRARERGIPYQDAFAQLQDEAYRPLTEAEERRREARQRAARRTLEVDEEALDKKATAYADKHGVPYTIALDAVIGTTPGAQRAVELEEAPLTVDTEDADLNRKVEAHAAKHNVAYEAALEAVLTEGR